MRLSSVGVFIFSLIANAAIAQFSEPTDELIKSAETVNYLFPVEPGSPNLLAGTMGELRSNHFHSGIDVRTNGRIGLPVMSAQQGFISRVSISSGGYGNALYVTHPNGHTTVYAHLDRFSKKISDYVRREQYKKKTFAINLYFSKGTFNVSRGDTIAFSGNSGSSSGPHLHFDIRDKNNEALNPLMFNFNEVIDTTPPLVQKIALRTMDINSRINDQFGRFEFYVVKEGNNYKLPFPILANGTIGVEFLGYDRLDNSRAKCGINHIEMYAAGERIFKQVIDKVNFNDTRNILTLMDYPTLQRNGERFNKLFIDDGNDLSYYAETKGKGTITVKSEEVPLKIVLKDTYGNQSEVDLTLKPENLTTEVLSIAGTSKSLTYRQLENILEIKSEKRLGDSLTMYVKKENLKITPAYSDSRLNVFLIDLRKKMPDSIRLGQEIMNTDFVDMIPSQVSYKYYSDIADINFPKGSLYDTVYLSLAYQNSNGEVFKIGDTNIPLKKNIHITLKPKNNYSEKFSVYRNTGRYNQFVGGTWANGKISFSAREFGEYAILHDTIPPSIGKISLNTGAARFKITDDLSGISYFEASINGQWLLMNYDSKISTIWAERLDSSTPLQGEFVLKVVDNAGNENIYQQKIP